MQSHFNHQPLGFVMWSTILLWLQVHTEERLPLPECCLPPSFCQSVPSFKPVKLHNSIAWVKKAE